MKGRNATTESGIVGFMADSPQAAGGAPLHPDVTSKFTYHPGGETDNPNLTRPGTVISGLPKGHYMNRGAQLPPDRAMSPLRQIRV